MLSGNAIESDRAYDFTAALTKCGKVRTHSNWEHAASYKQNITQFIKNCMNTCTSSQRPHLCRCRDSFGRRLVQFHYLLFFSSRYFTTSKKKNHFVNSRNKETWLPLFPWCVYFLMSNNGTEGKATVSNPCSIRALFPSITLSLYMAYIILTMRSLILCHF